MMDPKGACFLVGPQGFFYFEPNYDVNTPYKAWETLKGFFYKLTVYDDQSQKWTSREIKSNYKEHSWSFSAKKREGIPKISIEVLWERPSVHYLSSELRDTFIKSVQADHIFLAKFTKMTQLKVKLTQAFTFQDIVDVYHWMKNNVNS